MKIMLYYENYKRISLTENIDNVIESFSRLSISLKY